MGARLCDEIGVGNQGGVVVGVVFIRGNYFTDGH